MKTHEKICREFVANAPMAMLLRPAMCSGAAYKYALQQLERNTMSFNQRLYIASECQRVAVVAYRLSSRLSAVEEDRRGFCEEYFTRLCPAGSKAVRYG